MQEAREQTRHWARGLFSGSLVGIVIGIIGLVAAVVFGTLQLRPESNEVTLEVVSNDELTIQPEVEGLEGFYNYRGIPVAHLWKTRIRFTNTGDKTLVGAGQNSNIIGEALEFAFPDGTTLLNIEKGNDDFAANLITNESNKFGIVFDQWRSNEVLEVSLFVSSGEPLSEPPMPRVMERQIIDGDVRIRTESTEVARARKNYTDSLPRPIPTLSRVLAVIIFGVAALFGAIFIIMPLSEVVRIKRWSRRNLDSFAQYLQELPGTAPTAPEVKEEYLREPWKLPSTLWADFQGETLGVTNPLAQTLPIAIGWMIFGLFCLGGAFLGIFAILPL